MDDVFQIKEDQKDLYDVVKTTFANKDKEPPQAQSVSKKGVRETRKIWCDSDNAEWAASFDGKNPFAFDKRPLTAVSARVRDNLKKFLKRLEFLNTSEK